MPAGSAGSPTTKGEQAPERLGWTVGAAWGWFRAELLFTHRPSSADTHLAEQMVVATVSHPIGDGWSITVLAGAILDGELREFGDKAGATTLRHRVSTGGLVGVAFAKTLLDEGDGTPFVSARVKLAASYVPQVGDESVGDGMLAVDIRGAVTVGKTIADVFTPYLSVRAFGGPIVWWRAGETATGTDRFHAQVALGASLHIPLGDAATMTATFDASPVLERSLSASLSVAF